MSQVNTLAIGKPCHLKMYLLCLSTYHSLLQVDIFRFFCWFFFFFVGILIIYFWFKIRLSNVDRSDHRFSSYLEMQIQKKSRKKKVLTIKQKYLSQSYTMPINREGKKKKK